MASLIPRLCSYGVFDTQAVSLIEPAFDDFWDLSVPARRVLAHISVCACMRMLEGHLCTCARAHVCVCTCGCVDGVAMVSDGAVFQASRWSAASGWSNLTDATVAAVLWNLPRRALSVHFYLNKARHSLFVLFSILIDVRRSGMANGASCRGIGGHNNKHYRLATQPRSHTQCQHRARAAACDDHICAAAEPCGARCANRVPFRLCRRCCHAATRSEA